MCDMLLILKTTYFTGYADNTPLVVRDNITDVKYIYEGNFLTFGFYLNALCTK